MMQSTYGDDDDDSFAHNPFRNAGTAAAPGGGDLLGQPMPPPPQQQQQQHPLQPTAAQAGVPSFSQPQQLPDPASMPGQLQPPPPQQQQQPYYLSGQMDNRGAANNQTNNQIPSTPVGPCHRCTSCFRLEGYQPYFDLDTADVSTRLLAALTKFMEPDHFRSVVVGDAPSPQNSLKGPDLYGPLWVTMTLVFIVAATSNLSGYMHHQARQQGLTEEDEELEEFEYDINLLLRSSTVFAIFVVLIPSALWLASTCLSLPSPSWAMWICVYGYSMTPILVAAPLVWIPNFLFQWLLLSIAVGASALLVVRNLSTPLLSGQGGAADQAKASPVILSILAAHFVFFLVLKFAFYSRPHAGKD